MLGAIAARNPTSQASSIEPISLSLEAVLDPLNSTHLKASIQNTYSQPISILNWNNHFQRNQNGAHGSFKVVHQSPNGSVQVLQPASNRPIYRFLKPVPSHFINITGGGWSTAIFDLTQLFEIPDTDEYNVTMDFNTRATLTSNSNELRNQIEVAGQTADGLPNLAIRSKPLTMALDASTPDKTLRRRSGLGPCSNDQKAMAMLLRARDNARALAKYAQNVSRSGLRIHPSQDLNSAFHRPKTQLFGRNTSTIRLSSSA